MNTAGFCLLWSKTLLSSLWVQESKETRLVWLTLLMLKNSDGQVFSSLVGLADAAKVKLDECREAVSVLESPDPNDTSKVDEGRRIRPIPGGWQIVNADFYRFSTEAKREFWKIQKAEQREKEGKPKRSRKKREPVAGNGGTPLPGEAAYVKALEDGDDRAAEAVVDGLNAEGKVESSPVSSPAASGEGEKMDIPEIPAGVSERRDMSRQPRGTGVVPQKSSGQGLAAEPGPLRIEPSSGQAGLGVSSIDPSPAAPTVAAESGQWVDGEWVPD